MRRSLSNGNKRRIVNYHLLDQEATPSQIAGEFGICRGTVSKVLKEKEFWLSVSESNKRMRNRYMLSCTPVPCLLIGVYRPPKRPTIELELSLWVQRLYKMDAVPFLSDDVLRKKIVEVVEEQHLPKFKITGGWLSNVKKRIGIFQGIYNPDFLEKLKL
jgi:hypothetical protein